MKNTCRRIILATLMLSTIYGLSACSERSQSLSNKAGQRGEKPWAGTKNAHVAKGWTAGNEDSWRAQIRTRGQNQNEYVKTN